MPSRAPSCMRLDKGASLWLFVLVLVDTTFFLQSFREVLVGRNIVEALIPLVVALVLAVFLTPLLLRFLSASLLVAAAGMVVAVGRVCLLVPDHDPAFPIYLTGMVLTWAAWPCLLITALVLPVLLPPALDAPDPTNSSESHGLPVPVAGELALVVVTGLLGGAAFNLLLRQARVANATGPTVALVILAIFACVAWVGLGDVKADAQANANGKTTASTTSPRARAPRSLPGRFPGALLGALLGMVGALFVALPCMNVEDVAYATGIHYRAVAVAVALTLLLSALLAIRVFPPDRPCFLESHHVTLLVGFSALLPVVAIPLYGGASVVPFPLLLVVFVPAVLGLVVSLIFLYLHFVRRPSPHATGVVVLVVTFGHVLLVGVRFVQVVAHVPWLWPVLGALYFVGVALATWVEYRRNPPPSDKTTTPGALESTGTSSPGEETYPGDAAETPPAPAPATAPAPAPAHDAKREVVDRE